MRPLIRPVLAAQRNNIALRKQNGLACPDTEKKHPQKETEHNHANSCHLGNAQLKLKRFGLFFTARRLFSCCLFFGNRGSHGPGYIFSGADNPASSRPLRKTTRRARQR